MNPSFQTVEEYLAAEERADVKHEYLAGVPHAMAGASAAHNAALNGQRFDRPSLG